MSAHLITAEQREALQEIANIGMGQAGASIAKVLGEFICLSVPTIATLRALEIADAFDRLLGDCRVSAVRQAFHGSMRGEVVVIFGQHSAADLAELLGYDDVLDEGSEKELLLDISNVLVGACVGGIAGLLRLDVGFSAPSFLAHDAAPANLIPAHDVGAQWALLVEVRFKLEVRSFTCHLVLLMPEDEITALGAALDRFVASL
jgi:chemotaxis protein CheC